MQWPRRCGYTIQQLGDFVLVKGTEMALVSIKTVTSHNYLQAKKKVESEYWASISFHFARSAVCCAILVAIIFSVVCTYLIKSINSRVVGTLSCVLALIITNLAISSNMLTEWRLGVDMLWNLNSLWIGDKGELFRVEFHFLLKFDGQYFIPFD